MKASRPLALVTGARRGIGASIALQLAQEGFDIALTDVSNEGAQLVVEAAQAHGARAAFFESNLIHAETHQALIEQAVAWGGPIACLVNNAGIGAPSRGDLLDVTTNAFDVVLGVNLRGTFFLTQTVARHMLTASNTAPRSIITVSSVSAEMASIERGEYCISKAGLSMLTKLFALRLDSHATDRCGGRQVRPAHRRRSRAYGALGRDRGCGQHRGGVGGRADELCHGQCAECRWWVIDSKVLIWRFTTTSSRAVEQQVACWPID